jgi:hypothetical protein
MAVRHLVFELIFSLTFASNLVAYKFGINFGQVFWDFSGSRNHGQNGESISSSLFDTVPTDRGAYFSRFSESFIQLPPNEINSNPISLSSVFTLFIWLHPFDEFDYFLSYRINESSKSFFYLMRKQHGNSLKTRINKVNFDSDEKTSLHLNVLKNGKS